MSFIFLSFIFSTSLCYFLIKLNFTVPPSSRCSHKAPTPTAGGISLIIPFLLIFIYNLFFKNSINFYSSVGLITSIFILSSVSFIDDFSPLSYRIRLIAQIIVAFILTFSIGVIEIPVIKIHAESILFFQRFLTIFCFLCLVNGANFIDGLNGLLSLSSIIALAFAPIWVNFHPDITFFYYSLIASILGFFIFNFPKGRIFMGDVGSTFLGLILCSFALLAQPYYPFPQETAFFNKAFIFTLLPLSFLWFDVAFTLVRRAILGCRLTEPHRDHLIHILFDKGYGHSYVTLMYALGTVIMGTLTYLCHVGILHFISIIIIYSLLQFSWVLYVFNTPSRIKLS